jgi:hypothetical protein
MKFIILVGFLLNILIFFPQPSNRSERRQQAKTGTYRRQQ